MYTYMLLFVVAKQSSLFNDKSMEIQDLTLSVKQDIGHLNREIGELQQVQYHKKKREKKNEKRENHQNRHVTSVHLSSTCKRIVDRNRRILKHIPILSFSFFK
jgi:hypothetical protein